MEEKKQAIDKSIDIIWKSHKMDISILLAGALFGVVFGWNILEISIFIVFIGSILFSFPSRLLALPALFFLSVTPILLAMNQKDRAEEFAVYAYYFLVMAVIRGIIEVRKETN